MRTPNQVPEDARRALPQLDRLLDDPAVAALSALYGREQVKVQARRMLAALRERLGATPAEGATLAETPEIPETPETPEITEIGQLAACLAGELRAALGGTLRRVLNATGVFVHTNLGRAPLPRAVAAALPPLLDAYCDLEIDLASGRRGQRNGRVERLLTAATGAAAALAVNNNAAALLLCLAALAKDREVVVSRGELVEIGGSFRIPEILT
ncbi:MAG TPA: L-seryl-tRNA(Sec) selenium transferase, partial [Thermoanaerobaculia bacterium]|nr:L-seryl-tRNA(Sec) selenium transferase [Thermoanaerobaculia bacterium]